MGVLVNSYTEKKIPTYIFLGQSNMDGRGYWPTRPVYGQNGTLNPIYETGGTNDNTIIYFKTTADTNPNGTWENLHEFVNNVHPFNLADSNFGPEMAFMINMEAHKNTKCALIKYAKGGSGLNVDISLSQSWNVSLKGDQYNNMKNYLEDGLSKLFLEGSIDLKAVVWYQGYSDSDTLTHAQDYETNLTDLIEGPLGIRKILKDINTYWENVPIYILESPQEWVTVGTRTAPNLAALETSKQNVVALNPNNYYITDPGYSLFTDDIHLTGDSYSQLGIDLFTQLKDI